MDLRDQLRKGVLAAVAVLLLAGAAVASSPKPAELPAPLDRGFQAMYNLDFAAAHGIFRSYQQANPGDPMGYVANAAAYLFSEFDRLHILETDLFIDDHRFEQRTKRVPDAGLKA